MSLWHRLTHLFGDPVFSYHYCVVTKYGKYIDGTINSVGYLTDEHMADVRRTIAEPHNMSVDDFVIISLTRL